MVGKLAKWLNQSLNSSISKIIGFLLIIGGLLLIGFIYGPIFKEEFRYRTTWTPPQEKEIIPVSEDFGLIIPKIGVNAKVFPNVDSNNPNEYLPILTQGAAHAKGSVLPGEEGNIFIFAHSSDTPLNITQYNAVFYLIGKLKTGDEIVVHYNYMRYLYEVIDKKIIPPEVMSDYFRGFGGKTLTLQTCFPPGTSVNRLLVIAKEAD